MKKRINKLIVPRSGTRGAIRSEQVYRGGAEIAEGNVCSDPILLMSGLVHKLVPSILKQVCFDGHDTCQVLSPPKTAAFHLAVLPPNENFSCLSVSAVTVLQNGMCYLCEAILDSQNQAIFQAPLRANAGRIGGIRPSGSSPRIPTLAQLLPRPQTEGGTRHLQTNPIGPTDFTIQTA